MSRRAMLRTLLVAGATVLALLTVEGVGSLLLDRSLLRFARATQAVLVDVTPRNEAERRLAGAGNAGPYALHRDPRVGYVLRAGIEADVHDGRAHTDDLGLRRRTGPAHTGQDPLRVALLGDSVAFGYGLNDDEVIAQRLEDLLAAAQPPDAPPVECRTVAISGWNLRNSISFLLDHWDALQPDLVLLLLVGNDLDDTHGVLETGHLATAFDLALADPWLCSDEAPAITLKARLEAAFAAGADLGGPPALRSDLGAESRRRHDEAAGLIVQLDDVVARQGGRLLVVFLADGHLTVHLGARLNALAPRLPVRTLFHRLEPDMTLGDDPHPSAETAGVIAALLGADLVARSWIPTRPDAPAPSVPERYMRVLMPARTPDELTGQATALRDEALAALRPAVDFTTLEGLRQVYGDVHSDGSAGPRLQLILPARDGRLALELEPLAGRPDLLPLDVRVEADGAEIGVLRLQAPGPAHASFELPAAPAGALVREVRLVPERSVITWPDGVPQLASFRPLRIALEE